jgi:hypothetical protein
MKGALRPLVVLVADKNMDATVRELLQRQEALGIRPIHSQADVFVHPYRDTGVLNEAHDFLRPFHKQYQYALVLFDYEGCGHETKTPPQLQAEVRRRRESSGWSGRCEVILLVPELEVWGNYSGQAPGVSPEYVTDGLKNDHRLPESSGRQPGVACCRPESG